MLASTTMIWIVIPLVVGLLFLRPPETTSSATDRTVTGCPFLRDPRVIGMSARIAGRSGRSPGVGSTKRVLVCRLLGVPFVYEFLCDGAQLDVGVG